MSDKSNESPAETTVEGIISALSANGKEILRQVLELEQAKLHMGNPYKIVEEIKAAVTMVIK